MGRGSLFVGGGLIMLVMVSFFLLPVGPNSWQSPREAVRNL